VQTHLYELLVARAARYPAEPALGGQQGIGWRTLNSTDLLRAVDVLAAELGELGVAEGDRVVLWLPNHWRTPVYLFALWKLGAIPVPFDREMNPEAAARMREANERVQLLAARGGSNLDYPALVEAGRLVKEELDRWGAELVDELFQGLAPLACERVTNGTVGDAMFLNAAFLVVREREADLDRVVKEFNANYGNVVRILYVVSPPYNFSTLVEVS
jgi:hypothetical protein